MIGIYIYIRTIKKYIWIKVEIYVINNIFIALIKYKIQKMTKFDKTVENTKKK